MLRSLRYCAGATGLVCLWLVAVGATQPASKNDFHFSIIGDRTGEAQPQVYGRVWREVDLLHPDFVITAGDSIQGGNDATAESEWRQLRPIWDRYRYPLYVTPGNHDIWSEASRRIYEKQTGRPAHYSFNYQDAHFTVLDNSGSLELSQAELGFLEQDLEQNKARSPKFVFFHQPFWLIPVKLQSSDFPFHKLMQKYRVAYVVSGHVHQFDRMERDGIVYLLVGSSGGHLRAEKDFAHGWFFGHVWVRVKGTKIDVTVKEIDGPAGRGRMFRADEWDGGPKFNANDPAAGEKPAT